MMIDCRKLFANQGLRMTRQRQAIFEALATTQCHPTAEQLYELVCDQCQGLSLATVYNTLDALCTVGLCVRIPVERGSTRYDANLCRTSDGHGGIRVTFEAEQDPHLHAIDEQSGEIRDVPDQLGRELLEHIPRDVIKRVERELRFEVNRISLQLVGRTSSKLPAEVPDSTKASLR